MGVVFGWDEVIVGSALYKSDSVAQSKLRVAEGRIVFCKAVGGN